jgi:hypothetical protein
LVVLFSPPCESASCVRASALPIPSHHPPNPARPSSTPDTAAVVPTVAPQNPIRHANLPHLASYPVVGDAICRRSGTRRRPAPSTALQLRSAAASASASASAPLGLLRLHCTRDAVGRRRRGAWRQERRPSPTRFELQEDPRLLEEQRASRVSSISLHAVSSPFPQARFLLHEWHCDSAPV